MSSYVEQNNENEEVDIEKLNAALPRFVIRQQKLRENIDKIVVDSGKGFNMRKFVGIMATCRKFRQVVVVRFFRTTTNVSQFVTQGATNSVVKKYLTTATDGKNYRTKHYNLDVIISVGYRVKSLHGTQFWI